MQLTRCQVGNMQGQERMPLQLCIPACCALCSTCMRGAAACSPACIPAARSPALRSTHSRICCQPHPLCFLYHLNPDGTVAPLQRHIGTCTTHDCCTLPCAGHRDYEKESACTPAAESENAIDGKAENETALTNLPHLLRHPYCLLPADAAVRVQRLHVCPHDFLAHPVLLIRLQAVQLRGCYR